jgi:hypothetical protein
MKPRLLLPLLAAPLLHAQDLPQRAPGDSLDFEPKLMLDGPHAGQSPTPSPDDRVRQCTAALLQAQQRAAVSDQLFKEGVLARVEVEARALRVIQARQELAAATLTLAAAHADAAKESFAAHEASQSGLDSANTALKTAQDAATAANAEWETAQLAAAALDLQRKRKLYSEGVGSRLEVQMAEDRVALLSGTQPR